MARSWTDSHPCLYVVAFFVFTFRLYRFFVLLSALFMDTQINLPPMGLTSNDDKQANCCQFVLKYVATRKVLWIRYLLFNRRYTMTTSAGAAAMNTPSVDSSAIERIIPPTLLRLTDGLPIHELHQMVAEAKDCEAALLAEINLLEKALKDEEMDPTETASVDRLLTSEYTPPDRFFTISSLMGRLRDPLAPPLPPTSSRRLQQVKRKQDKQGLDRYQALLALESHPEYTRKHADPTQLLAAWKRLSSHRTAGVFRRSVNPKEAPGYTERILFPIDLQLIRKMISASIIQSFCDLHHRLLLICHNCVKFNGRHSDYGIVTRDFEAYVDEVLLQLVLNPPTPAQPPAPTPPPLTTTTTGTTIPTTAATASAATTAATSSATTTAATDATSSVTATPAPVVQATATSVASSAVPSTSVVPTAATGATTAVSTAPVIKKDDATGS